MENDMILQALQVQAEHINGNTTLALVESDLAAITGNIFHPSILWVQALPTDNLNFAKGLPKVVVFPASEKSAELWKKTNIGKVLSTISNPVELVPKFDT